MKTCSQKQPFQQKQTRFIVTRGLESLDNWCLKNMLHKFSMCCKMGVDSKTQRKSFAQHLYVLQASFEEKYLFSGVLGHYDSGVYAETRPGDVASSGI